MRAPEGRSAARLLPGRTTGRPGRRCPRSRNRRGKRARSRSSVEALGARPREASHAMRSRRSPCMEPEVAGSNPAAHAQRSLQTISSGHRAPGDTTVSDAAPSSLALADSGELARRAATAPGLLGRRCEVCPRGCTVDRLDDEHGLCAIGRQAVVASYFPHFGEEDCLRGWRARGRSSSAAATCAASSARTTTSRGRCEGERVSPGAARRDDARAPGDRLPQRQLGDARARRAADPGGAAARRRRRASGFRSSTTRAPTTASTASRCWRASWTSTCPTSRSLTSERARRYLKPGRLPRRRPRDDPRDAPPGRRPRARRARAGPPRA